MRPGQPEIYEEERLWNHRFKSRFGPRIFRSDIV